MGDEMELERARWWWWRWGLYSCQIYVWYFVSQLEPRPEVCWLREKLLEALIGWNVGHLGLLGNILYNFGLLMKEISGGGQQAGRGQLISLPVWQCDMFMYSHCQIWTEREMTGAKYWLVVAWSGTFVRAAHVCLVPDWCICHWLFMCLERRAGGHIQPSSKYQWQSRSI